MTVYFICIYIYVYKKIYIYTNILIYHFYCFVGLVVDPLYNPLSSIPKKNCSDRAEHHVDPANVDPVRHILGFMFDHDRHHHHDHDSHDYHGYHEYHHYQTVMTTMTIKTIMTLMAIMSIVTIRLS